MKKENTMSDEATHGHFINRVTVEGYLETTPEVRFLDTGTAVCTFRLITEGTWKDKVFKQRHNIVAYGKLGEELGEKLGKGQWVLIAGELSYRNWKDQEEKWHNKTEIKANGYIPGESTEIEQEETQDPAPADKCEREDDIPF